jgi:succinate dehydrogenase hydrophobic anchor subunit
LFVEVKSIVVVAYTLHQFFGVNVSSKDRVKDMKNLKTLGTMTQFAFGVLLIVYIN